MPEYRNEANSLPREEYHSIKHIPGNSSYSNISRRGKKVALLSDSMCHGLNIPRLNRQLKNKNAFKKIHPGATPLDLNYYSKRTLEMEKPDICIIHVGTNKIGKDEPFDIAKGIVETVKTCHEFGANTVYVSSIIYREDYPDIVVQLNNILRSWQITYDYTLIYNDNIDANCLAGDRHHLSRWGKDKLSDNFSRALNNSHD